MRHGVWTAISIPMPCSSAISLQIFWWYVCRYQLSTLRPVMIQDISFANRLQVLQLHMTMQRRIGIIGVLLLGTMCVTTNQRTTVAQTDESQVYRSVNSPNSLRVSNPSRWPRKTNRRRRYLPLPSSCSRNPIQLTLLPPSEGVTTLLYWGMLEAGISLIATNLPSLHFLVTEKSLQPFAASIRTAVSFSSLRSQASKAGTGTRSPYSKVQQNVSKAPEVPVLRKGWENGGGLGTVDTFAMYDMERAVEVREPGLVHVACEMWQQGNVIWAEIWAMAGDVVFAARNWIWEWITSELMHGLFITCLRSKNSGEKW